MVAIAVSGNSRSGEFRRPLIGEIGPSRTLSRKFLLLASAAALSGTLCSGAALAGKDGVVFDGATNNASATGTGSIGISSGTAGLAQASGNSAIAIGRGGLAETTGATAIGAGAAAGTNANPGIINLGAAAAGDSATAVGANAIAAGTGATAVGGQNQNYGALANGNGATALGTASRATGANTVALGNSAIATAGSVGSSTAIGTFSLATNDGTSLGYNARATGPLDSVAVGQNSVASGIASVAVGGSSGGAQFTRAAGTFSTAVGGASQAFASNSVALGYNSLADQDNTVSVGSAGLERRVVNVANGTVAAGSTDAVTGDQLFTTNQQVATNTANLGTLGTTTAAALGGGSTYDPATGVSAPSYNVQGGVFNNVGGALTALDTQVTANTSSIAALQSGQAGAVRENNTSGAPGPVATGANSIAVGSGSVASGAQSVAVGQNSQATATGATAVGYGAVANGANSSVFGTNNTVTGANSGAFGTANTVNGNGSYAFGDPNVLNGNNSFIVGDNNNVNVPNAAGNGNNINVVGSGNTLASTASASGSNVFGGGNTVNGANAIAIGNGNTVGFDNSVAIGNGVTTSRTNQVAIGTAVQTYTMAGISSAASRAAQTGATRFVTTDASGNLATSTFDPASVAALDGRVGALEAHLNKLRKESRRGVASAMALSSAPMPSAPGRLSYVLNGATYRGESAVGGSVAYRLDTNVPIAITGGVAGSPGGGVGGRFGIMGEL